jgi:hypothetical protein
LRDVRNLAAEALDEGYVRDWAERLGVLALWEEARR